MIRYARDSDALALVMLLNSNRDGDVKVDRDVIVVNESSPSEPPTSVLVWRPCALVHEFEVGAGLARLRTAKSLVDFSMADAKQRRMPMRDAIFLVNPSNVAMLRFVESLPGAREDHGRIFYVEF